jgi:hypothetical protein
VYIIMYKSTKKELIDLISKIINIKQIIT